jgi:hypothetical protein
MNVKNMSLQWLLSILLVICSGKIQSASSSHAPLNDFKKKLNILQCAHNQIFSLSLFCVCGKIYNHENFHLFEKNKNMEQGKSNLNQNKRIITKSKLREYRDAFSLFDKDGNGYLTKEELGHVMHKVY